MLVLILTFSSARSTPLADEIEKLTAALQQLQGSQSQATLPANTGAIKIITPPPAPPPRQIPIVVQTATAAHDDVTNLVARVLGQLQSKLSDIRKEADKLQKKRDQLETQQKELNLKIANENVRHREELKSLHKAHVQIQAELEAAKKERERLERERLDKILQRN